MKSVKANANANTNTNTLADSTADSSVASVLSKKTFAVVAFVAAVIVGALFYRRRQQKSSEDADQSDSSSYVDVEEPISQDIDQEEIITTATAILPTSRAFQLPPTQNPSSPNDSPSVSSAKIAEPISAASSSATDAIAKDSVIDNALSLETSNTSDGASLAVSSDSIASASETIASDTIASEDTQTTADAKKAKRTKKKKSGSSASPSTQRTPSAKELAAAWDPQRDPVFNAFLVKNFMTMPPTVFEDSGIQLPLVSTPSGELGLDASELQKEENHWVGMLFEGLAMMEQGRKDYADNLFNEASRSAKKFGNFGAMALANFCQGYFNAASGAFEKGLTNYLLALRLWEKHQPEGHPATLYFMFDLAQVYKELHKLKEALELYQKCKALIEKGHVASHFCADFIQEVIADVYAMQEKFQESEALLDEVMKARTGRLPPSDPLIASAKLSQSLVKRRLGKIAESEKLDAEWTGLLLEAYQGNKAILAQCLNALATMYRTHKMLPACEQMCLLTISAMKDTYQESSTQYAHALVGYADLLRELKRFNESMQTIENAQRIFLRLKNRNDPDVAAVKATKARLLGDMGRISDAEDLFMQAITSLGQNPHENMVLALSLYHEFLVSQNQLDRAEQVKQEIARTQMIFQHHS
eukprot:TRINITY_DN3165_c0_g1_i1.p1 TRINITY_DN3165_c0_g1~~TRINITY_DN3165_c0_g1_i1.p1  ORF type:complete len:646 (+),score=176.45 TRINITY_DN3165_c0_g1_i1:44-1981(+)